MYNYEWFKEKAHVVHGDEYLYEQDSYVTTKTKMWMTHKKCGYRFQQTPHNHLAGQGCPMCGKEYARTHKKYDYEHFLKTAKERFGDRYSFPYIDKEYENSHSKITVKCNLCENEFIKIACDFVCSKTGGCWCKEKKKDTITYNEIVSKINGYTVEYFDEPKIVKTDKVKLTCQKCGYSYNARICSILKGKNMCKACAGRKHSEQIKLTVDEVKQRMDNKWPTIEVDYTTYTKTMSYVDCKCKKCGHQFKRKVNTFFNGVLHGDPCPKCNKEIINKQRTKTTDEFIEEVNKIHGQNTYTVLSEYKSSDQKVMVKCNDCGREFSIEANSFLQGHGCPYHNCNSSGKEKEISEYIKTIYNGDVYNNDRKVLDGKELDIYIPAMKIAFEFDGVFWHNENNKPNNYHLWKTEECIKKGVRLIHIFEDEWKRKKDVWKSMISNILGTTKYKIYARKCEIRKVNTKECTQFLEQNHLQSWCPSQIKLGLYYNNELVSLMTFGKSRHYAGIGNNETEYELLRFCNKLHTSVIGGASKLFSYFVNTYRPLSVVSYADRRWSQGILYNKLGFTFDHYSKPNYFYVIGENRKNRFNFRKSILVKKYGCPLNMSEREFCKQQKWYRIYDCGTMVYKWFNKD